jgi:hypothetical protein
VFGQTAGTATLWGRTYSMQWFQMGAKGNAYHGQSGQQTLTLFMRERRAYLSKYTGKESYERTTCVWLDRNDLLALLDVIYDGEIPIRKINE